MIFNICQQSWYFRVKNFLDTNVDLMEYNEPVDLLFDVTEFKADKQVRML